MESSQPRLLVVSNRLPVTIKSTGKGKYEYQVSSGGLNSGLSALAKEMKFQWFGWPGMVIPEEDVRDVSETLRQDYDAVPVFLEEDLADKHYNGFSNSVLWPLLHYYPDKMSFDESFGEAYEKVNQRFADVLAAHVHDNDMIWIHDYHLMTMAKKLRHAAKDKKNIKIGFFLHTAFPSRDFFTILPKRDALLQGLLSCDLVGFHTAEYEEHFRKSCASILKCDISQQGLVKDGEQVNTGVFPIGIDPEDFRRSLDAPDVQEMLKQLKQRFSGQRVIIGVDRMDYIKGIPQKLQAFDVFLTSHPEWKEKVVLVQIAIPTRPDVKEYQDLRNEVNGLIGKIEGKHGSATYAPIHFMYKSVSKTELVALYALSDVCLISSTRDGMNLVSYEYMACQRENHGVLVTSEYTGAAETLSGGALVVNPWHSDEFAQAIHDALVMKDEERGKKYETSIKYIDKHTRHVSSPTPYMTALHEVMTDLYSFYWGRTFLKALREGSQQCEKAL